MDAKDTSPANTPRAITVGATDITDTRAFYSNFGPAVTIFAPGSNVTSDWIGSTTAVKTISGTSMATPLVAGLVAYLLDINIMGPKATPDFMRAYLQSQATLFALNLTGVRKLTFFCKFYLPFTLIKFFSTQQLWTRPLSTFWRSMAIMAANGRGVRSKEKPNHIVPYVHHNPSRSLQTPHNHTIP